MRSPTLMIAMGIMPLLTMHVLGAPRYMLVGQEEPAIVATYSVATEALAADDFEKARVTLTALARQSQGALRRKVDVALAAPDIRTMRAAFREVSEVIIPLGVPAGYAVFICRMFNGRWIQRIGSIANPYFGKDMLTCGIPESEANPGPITIIEPSTQR
jgi:hypothetical protein